MLLLSELKELFNSEASVAYETAQRSSVKLTMPWHCQRLSPLTAQHHVTASHPFNLIAQGSYKARKLVAGNRPQLWHQTVTSTVLTSSSGIRSPFAVSDSM